MLCGIIVLVINKGPCSFRFLQIKFSLSYAEFSCGISEFA